MVGLDKRHGQCFQAGQLAHAVQAHLLPLEEPAHDGRHCDLVGLVQRGVHLRGQGEVGLGGLDGGPVRGVQAGQARRTCGARERWG